MWELLNVGVTRIPTEAGSLSNRVEAATGSLGCRAAAVKAQRRPLRYRLSVRPVRAAVKFPLDCVRPAQSSFYTNRAPAVAEIQQYEGHFSNIITVTLSRVLQWQFTSDTAGCCSNRGTAVMKQKRGVGGGGGGCAGVVVAVVTWAATATHPTAPPLGEGRQEEGRSGCRLRLRARRIGCPHRPHRRAARRATVQQLLLTAPLRSACCSQRRCAVIAIAGAATLLLPRSHRAISRARDPRRTRPGPARPGGSEAEGSGVSE